MNNELFQLCKEVYEKVGWDKTHQILVKLKSVGTDTVTVEKWHNNGDFKIGEEEAYPLYTSDYLLGKLQHYPVIKVCQLSGKRFYAERQWGELKGLSELLDSGVKRPATTETEVVVREVSEVADTPLLALLKLTIALANSGQLKETV